MTLCQLESFRETEPQEEPLGVLYVYAYLFVYMCVYFKELAHAFVGDGKSVKCRAGWRACCSGRISVTVLRQNFFFGKSSFSQFLLLRPTSHCGWLTHIMEYSLLYLKSTDSES